MAAALVAPQQFVDDLIDQRRRLGLDKRDEVWQGVYHVAPHEHSDNGIIAGELHEAIREAGLRYGGSFNLGTDVSDFRVPDRGYHRAPPGTLYVASAPLVIEVLSPDDQTWDKLPFYFGRAVEEVWVVDPHAHTVGSMCAETRRTSRPPAARCSA